MDLGTMAERTPERPALIIGDGEVVLSYAELDARSNQFVHALRSLGVGVGDTIAVMLENCEQFFEVWWAAMRSGLYLTTINWHLTAPEVEYVVSDSEAKLVVYSGRLGDVVDSAVRGNSAIQLVSVGETGLSGALDYGSLREAQPSERLAHEQDGSPMFYSSGTTGRPKGIRRQLSGCAPSEGHSAMAFSARRYGLPEGCRYLSPGPLYHAAPSIWCAGTHTVGGTAIVMRHFDPEQALLLIDHQRVTESQWVPTMLHRMLRLPEDVRRRYDLSSHQRAWTAAAPISIELKRQMIDWWGKILYEYYGSSEGGGTIISTDEWLQRPGSVGRHYTGDKIHILDPTTHEELPPRQEGIIYFQPQPGRQFEYHNDPEKTAEAHHGELVTAGDIGYLDEEDYLFLTDRQSNMIIAGGVNIYPREIEEAIASHPGVADVAVFGVPDEDLGEQVYAVVQPIDPTQDDDALITEITRHLQLRLARNKVPRTFEIRGELPRDENGKLYKRLLRDEHWKDQPSRLV